MVNSSSSGSPRVDADAYPTLQETIQNLGKGYRMGGNLDFDESSSNFAWATGEPNIPRIHIPLQIDDRSSRDILYSRGNSSDEDTESIYHASGQEAEQTKWTANGAQASTSTLVGPPLDAPSEGGAKAQP